MQRVYLFILVFDSTLVLTTHHVVYNVSPVSFFLRYDDEHMAVLRPAVAVSDVVSRFLCVFKMPVMMGLEPVDSPCHCRVWGVIGDVCPDWSMRGVTMRDVSGKFSAASLTS